MQTGIPPKENKLDPHLDPPTAVARREVSAVRGAPVLKCPAEAAPARKDMDGRASARLSTTAADVDPPLCFMSFRSLPFLYAAQVCRPALYPR